MLIRENLMYSFPTPSRVLHDGVDKTPPLECYPFAFGADDHFLHIVAATSYSVKIEVFDNMLKSEKLRWNICPFPGGCIAKPR